LPGYVISPVSREIVSIPDLTVAVSDRSVTSADPIHGLAETIVAIIFETRRTIATSLIFGDAGWICDPARSISTVSKARYAIAAIETSRCELTRPNRSAAAGVERMLTKRVRRRASSHR
jgi:hypothetical protein